jgi:Thioredoxin domain
MIPEREKKQIANWSRALKEDIFIRLILTGDERSRTFQDFCETLAHIVPRIKLKKEKDQDSKFPIIRVGNVAYQAIPTDQELGPFLGALSGDGSGIQNMPSMVRHDLFQVRIPAHLKIYIMPHCPFCPALVKQLLLLAAASPFIRLTVIDGALFPESAASDRIRTAPTVLMDDQFHWSGSIRIQDIVDMILSRDPSKLSALSLKAMFEEGDAVKVAEMMLDNGKIFPALLELLVHQKWPVRLAAMVTFETIAEKNRPLVRHTIPFLWNAFPQAEDTVKGDILYLLGITGDKEIIPKLKTVLNGPYVIDVKEAAEEALQALK